MAIATKRKHIVFSILSLETISNTTLEKIKMLKQMILLSATAAVFFAMNTLHAFEVAGQFGEQQFPNTAQWELMNVTGEKMTFGSHGQKNYGEEACKAFHESYNSRLYRMAGSSCTCNGVPCKCEEDSANCICSN